MTDETRFRIMAYTFFGALAVGLAKLAFSSWAAAAMILTMIVLFRWGLGSIFMGPFANSFFKRMGDIVGKDIKAFKASRPEKQEPEFDADAVFKRAMEKRGRTPTAPVPPTPPRQRKTFGRRR